MTQARSVAVALAAQFFVACGGDSPSARQADPVSARDAAAVADGPYVSKAAHCTRADTFDAGAPDASEGGDDASPSGLALPQIVNLGGPTLDQATLVAVTFAGDPFADELEDYVASVGCTDYWHAVADEYGVGDAVAAPPIRLAESPPPSITDPQIAMWLGSKIDGHDPQFATPVSQTIYIVFYPDSTTVTVPDTGGTSCVNFAGYHSALTLGDGSALSYAVIPRCGTPVGAHPIPDPTRGVLAMLTSAASHEIVEATTDPQPPMAPTYAQTDPNHLAYYVAGLTEVADLCSQQSGATFVPRGYPWSVARAWSNHAASVGDNPCVPAETSNYFYAAPVLTDSGLVRIGGLVVTAPTVQLAVSATATIDVRMTSNFAAGPIDVHVVDGSAFEGGPQYLTLSLDRTTAMPGDTIHLTIQKDAANSDFSAESFVLISTLAGVDTLFWGMTSD